jgi:tetratricopeptide (TPR) repeat protein
MIDSLLERANQLIQLQRYADAEKELKQVLSVEPNRAQALALLAICQAEQNNLKEAVHFIQQAIAQEPDNDYFLYLHAFFLLKQDKLKEAEKLAQSAIAYEPHNADYFGLLALIRINQKEWQSALDHANQGLSVDPDNLTCLNARSTALFKLDKKSEAYDTIEKALSKDPENAVTHTNLGWGLLERGDHKKALEHFREALKINPDFDYAKAGLVQGLKARYWFYRMFLKYVFWISNLKGKAQWIVILGLFFGVKLLRGIAETNPELAIVITPLIYLYFAFAISTWIVGPLSNLFLRLNVYGRFALTEDEIRSSTYVGIALLIGLLGGVAFLFTNNLLFVTVLIFGISMMIPLASMFNPPKQQSRSILIGYTILLGAMGVGAIYQQATTGDVGLPGTIYIFALLIYQWVANAMVIR